MFFFTSIFNAPVSDNTDKVVGKVKDLLIRIDADKEFPAVAGVIVAVRRQEKRFVAANLVETWGSGEIELIKKEANCFSDLPEAENIISIRETVLDKQIVDLTGLRLVRVNDLRFDRIYQTMSLVAIDISNRGLFRRLGLRSRKWDKLFKIHFLEWKNIRLVDNKLHLSQGAQDLTKLHPADIANVIEKMNVSQGSIFLQSLDQATAARVLEEIQPEIKTLLVKNLGTERATSLLEKMSLDELVDLIQLLPRQESLEIINKISSGNKSQKIKKLLEYDEDTAGGLMTTEFLIVNPEQTVASVLSKIKEVSPLHHSLQFVYVVDREEKFLGVISLRSLIISDPNRPVHETMKKAKKLPTVHVEQNLEEIAALMTKYNLLSVAVLDDQHKLIGVVTADDIMRRLIPEA